MTAFDLLWNTIRAADPIDRLVDVLDILFVAYIIYETILFLRGTRALSLVKGLLLLILLLWVTTPLPTFHWLIEQLLLPGVIAIVIIFQPELRMTLERLGRGGRLRRAFAGLGGEQSSRVIREVATAVAEMSESKVGALIALERETGLEDVARSGTRIGARVSAELLQTIFFPASPLHDGAVVIRGEEILAAGCVLPQSDAPYLPVSTGLRHRAAIGLTERTDAVCVVVSEETQAISLAVDGALVRNLDRVRLSERLHNLLEADGAESANRRWAIPWRRSGGGS